jgi:hypothetical protein
MGYSRDLRQDANNEDNAPSIEGDESDESTKNYWKRPFFWDKNVNQSSEKSTSVIASKKEGESP